MNKSVNYGEGLLDDSPKGDWKSTALKWALVGAVIMCAVWLVIYYVALKTSSDCGTSPAPWNAADYETVDEWYQSQPVHGLNINDNMRADRLSAGVLSPDGQTYLFTRKQYQMPNSMQSTSTVHIIQMNGGSWLNTNNSAIQLTRPIWGISDSQPLWNSDGSVILFLSNRPSDGSTQVFYMPYNPTALPSSGNFLDPIQLTSYSLNVDNMLISPTDELMVFSCQCYPNMTIDETAQMKQNISDSGIDAFVLDKLFARHWDQWRDGTRNTPWAVPIMIANQKVALVDGVAPFNLMFGVDSDSPTKPYGGIEEWNFSPNGTLFTYQRRHDETSQVAFSTDIDIYLVTFMTINPPTANPPTCMTCWSQAQDVNGRFSPDGNWLAWLAMTVPEYESDRQQVIVQNLNDGTMLNLTSSWSLSVSAATWAWDSQSLWLELLEDGDSRVYQMFLDGTYDQILLNGSYTNVQPTPDGTAILVAYSHWQMPINILASSNDGMTRNQLSNYNNVLLQKCQTTTGEKFYFIGANGDQVAGWMFPPVNLDTSQKYPVAFLIHGGPQSAWEQGWSYRWNPQVYTGAGWAVIAINPHGSTGYGQPFVDSIQYNYGGAPWVDLYTGLDIALLNYSFLNGSAVAALGASYGGFMINWIAGQKDQNSRFRVLVCHDGMFDIRAFYYGTEELWFPEHDIGGTPWWNASNYEQWNPANATLVSQWYIPQLVIHGGLDYRIPVSQGLGAFNALQRQGIPSQFLYFPNENHWVLNQRNQIQWHETVLAWITQWTQ